MDILQLFCTQKLHNYIVAWEYDPISKKKVRKPVSNKWSSKQGHVLNRILYYGLGKSDNLLIFL